MLDKLKNIFVSEYELEIKKGKFLGAKQKEKAG